MSIISIAERHGSFEDKVTHIGRELALFEELFGSLKRAGTHNLFIPTCYNEALHDRLLFLSASAERGRVAVRAELLRQQLAELGTLFGFDMRGYVYRDNRYELDLSNVLPTCDGVVMFPWDMHSNVQESILHSNNLNSEQAVTAVNWRDREIGPIFNSIDDVVVTRPGLTIFTSTSQAMTVHGLTYVQMRDELPDGVDTRLSFDFGYDALEGFMSHVHFLFRNGGIAGVRAANFVAELYGQSVDHPRNARAAIDKIRDDLCVSPQNILHYLTHSNLTQQHLHDIRGLVALLEEYGPRLSSELFPVQETVDIQAARSTDRYAPRLDERVALYKNVSFDSLTISDFEQLRISSKSLYVLWFSFNHGDQAFSAGYVHTHPTGPYINLSGPADRQLFADITEILRKTFQGSRTEIRDRDSGFETIINLPRQSTLFELSSLFRNRFNGLFSNLDIDTVHYQNVLPNSCPDNLNYKATGRILL